jgi:hypothetical protein
MRQHVVRRHARWVIPVVGAAGAWTAVAWAGQYEQTHPDGRGAAYALIVLGGVAAIVLTLACVIIAVRNGWRTRKAIVRERHDAILRQQQQNAYANGWRAARALAAHLSVDKPLAPLTVWGLVLRPRETAYLDLSANVSQVVTNFNGDMAWSAPTAGRVIATDQRLLINTGHWTIVAYMDVVALYPELEEWQVTIDGVGAPAVRLVGPLAPVLAVYLTAVLFRRAHRKREAHVAR